MKNAYKNTWVVSILFVVGSLITLYFKSSLAQFLSQLHPSLNTILLYTALVLSLIISFYCHRRLGRLMDMKWSLQRIVKQIDYSLQKQLWFLLVYWLLLLRYVISSEKIDLFLAGLSLLLVFGPLRKTMRLARGLDAEQA
ncbi:hypothetical protein [Carboxylicivirga sp. M1479]|uniref:hypothetical protein n=1 Tax=Carboxylicivirga sp. M1479 TaxID=2594476 RepID=UPI00117890AB|nr:hypothetical protein [Carboxylicivirga sp. M1479]TRX72448.1 hypothetical protein FNN09_00490 [Carboxylicivirga sp. M1479]